MSLLRFALFLLIPPVATFARLPSARAETPPENSRPAADALPEAGRAGPHPGPRTLGLEAVEGGWTARRVGQRALEVSPQLRSASAGVRESREGLRQTRLGLWPQLELGGRYTRVSDVQNGAAFGGGPSLGEGSDGGMLELGGLLAGEPDRLLWEGLFDQLGSTRFPVVRDLFSLRASAVYPVSELLSSVLPAVDAARAIVRVRSHQADRIRSEVVLVAQRGFYVLLRARGQLAVARSARVRALARVEQARSLVAAGTIAAVQLEQARASSALASVDVARANGQRASAEAGLRVLLDTGDSERFESGEALESDEVLDTLARAGLPDLDALVERATAQREDLRALEARVQALEHNLRAARRRGLPSVSLAASYELANPAPRVFPQEQAFGGAWDLSALLSFSPNSWLQGRAEAGQARARFEQAGADLELARRGMVRGIAEARAGLQASRAAVPAARVAVQASASSYAATLGRFRAGAAVVRELTEADADLVRARVGLLDAVIGVRLAWLGLEHALGELVPVNAPQG